MKLNKEIIENFENVISAPNSSKLERLHYDLLYKSRAFKFENNKQSKKVKYPVFKRGTILFIDFGVNVYSEFSGPHFAIVLNKKDHPFNPNLTVVPLSSKNKKQYIEIPHGISEFLDLYFAQYEFLFRGEITMLKPLVEEIFEKHENLTELSQEDYNLMEHMSHIADELKQFQEYKQKMFDKLGKKTFANVSSIMTISKRRIHKSKNKFDINGRLTLNEYGLKEVLDGINKFI